MNPFFAGGKTLDLAFDAFAIVSGAISGVTPRVSAWERVVGTDTATLVGSTTATVAGTWKVELASDAGGAGAVDQITLPNPTILAPATSGGGGSGSFVIAMRGYSYVRITFTPTSGAGNANVNLGAMVGRWIGVDQANLMSAQLYSPTTSTMAGTWKIEVTNAYDNNYATSAQSPSGLPPIDISADFVPVIPAMVTGGQNIAPSMQSFPYRAWRITFTPTSGTTGMSVVVYDENKALG